MSNNEGPTSKNLPLEFADEPAPRDFCGKGNNFSDFYFGNTVFSNSIGSLYLNVSVFSQMKFDAVDIKKGKRKRVETCESLR